jgi:predicted nucleic acid-binding protein
LYYLDSSAILKLIFEEKETFVLNKFLKGNGLTSELSRLEVIRVINRTKVDGIDFARKILNQFNMVDINKSVIKIAELILGQPNLRSLDAIHLATAMFVESEIEGLVTYDKKMFVHAENLNIKVLSPA